MPTFVCKNPEASPKPPTAVYSLDYVLLWKAEIYTIHMSSGRLTLSTGGLAGTQ